MAQPAAGVAEFIARVAATTLLCALAACGGGSGAAPAPAPLAITTTSLPDATAGTAFSYPLAAAGGTAPYSWSISGGALPAGLTLSPQGVLAGAALSPQSATITIRAADAGTPEQATTRQFALVVSPALLSVVTTAPLSATTNTPYTATLQAAGGTAPYTWSVRAGALPAGLSLSPSGTLSGTPTTGGTASITIGLVDSGTPAQSATATLTLTVAIAPLAITTTNLSGALVNANYVLRLAASGGSGAYAWSLTAGNLPAGITLGADGSLSGTPTAVGLSSFTATVADAGDPPQTTSHGYNLLVGPGGALTSVTLATTPSPVAVDSTFAGLSYEKSKLSTALFGPANTTLVALLKRLGPGLLRIGGNSVDDTLWNAAGPGLIANQVAPTDVDRLSGFLKAANWKVLYGIEFLDEQASPVALADPALVAQEAVYALRSLGTSLYGFELGNEPDLYHDRIPTLDYAAFQARWQVYHDAIVTAVSQAVTAGTLPPGTTARFTGPAAAYNQSAFVAPFAQSEAADIFLLTRHYYLANGQDPTSTMALLLTPDPLLPGYLSAMQASASDNHIGSGFRLAEANSFYNGGAPGVSDGFGTSLWAINFLFTNAWAGSAGVNFHGGGSGPGYTPIADNGSSATGVRPEYYGIYLFSQAARGQLIATTVSPATSSLYAYAVAGSAGTNVLLVNTSPATAYTVAVRFNGTAASASYVSLTGPSLGSTSGALLNGAAIAPDGSWPALTPAPLPVVGGILQVPVAAGSALLLIAQ